MPNDIHAFVGSVGLAGMHGELWSVDGGNYRVAEELIKIAKANLIPSRVSTKKETIETLLLKETFINTITKL